MGGMITSLTSDVTTPPRATPMMTPMARARALLLVRNSRNPLIDGSVLDDLRQVLGLGDPVGELALARDAPHDAGTGRDDLLDRRREVGRVALGQLGGGVDAGRLEQVGVLGADAR